MIVIRHIPVLCHAQRSRSEWLLVGDSDDVDEVISGEVQL